MAKVKIHGLKRFEVIRKKANTDTYFKQPFVISFIPNNVATFDFLSYVLKQDGINEIEYKNKAGVKEYKISDVVLVKRETYIDMFYELEKIIICKIKRKRKPKPKRNIGKEFTVTITKEDFLKNNPH